MTVPARNDEAPHAGLRARSSRSMYGAGKGTRTLDPDLGKVVLYQLSYSRVDDARIAGSTLEASSGIEPL